MADENVVQEQEGVEGKKIGMWAALCMVITAIAANIKAAGPVEMSNMFRVLFRSQLATILVLGGGAFLWKAAFMQKAFLNEHTVVIVGFVTASVIGVAVGFYFGGQDRAKQVPPTEGSEK